MDSLLKQVIEEQIAGLRASANVFVQQRAEHLAAAEAASVNEDGALARANQLQAALDAATEAE